MERPSARRKRVSYNVGERMLRMARDLVAKRVIEQHVRRRSAAKRSLSALQDFQQLPCCVEAAELQECLEKADQQLNRQTKDYKVVSQARMQEVGQLAVEVACLQALLVKEGKLTAPPTDAAKLDMEASSMQHQMECENLEQQLTTIEAEIEAAEQQILQIQWAAASDMAQLGVLRALHEQEVAMLKARVTASNGPSHPQAPYSQGDVHQPMSGAAANGGFGLIAGNKKSAEELGRSLQAAVTERESMETLLQTERAYRLEEICLLKKELRQVRASNGRHTSSPRSDCMELKSAVARAHDYLVDSNVIAPVQRAEEAKRLAKDLLQQTASLVEN